MMLTNEHFLATAQAIATTVIEACAAVGLQEGDATDAIGAAALEALAQMLGGMPQAIERLRLLADVAERQILNGIG